MEKLKFYDLKRKKAFFSTKWTTKVGKGGRKYAIAVAPSGCKACRIVGMVKSKKKMKGGKKQ